MAAKPSKPAEPAKAAEPVKVEAPVADGPGPDLTNPQRNSPAGAATPVSQPKSAELLAAEENARRDTARRNQRNGKTEPTYLPVAPGWENTRGLRVADTRKMAADKIRKKAAAIERGN